ncbi:MAG: glycosyltransferase family 2 protein [Candidatus Andersenbacteria bacterium]|nr:glycosyltransferase family 2 protein [Candidatus Andersenbacteria bacterium]
MNPQNRKYYVILVHYKNEQATHQALHALRTCAAPPDEIIIIDHAEHPFQYEASPTIVVRRNHNTGYAGGINSGLSILLSRHVQGHDIIVAMNNDVTVYPDTFQELRRWWDVHPSPALLGVVTEEPHGTVSGLSYINLLTGRSQLYSRPRCALPYIHGAFFTAPFELFMCARGLPEHYFLYWEDAAFSARVRALRLPLQAAPRVRVAHHASAAPPRGAPLYYLVRNGALFLERATPAPWRLSWWLLNRLRLIYHLLHSGSDRHVKRALFDAVRRRLGPRAA